jgi:hypothetical protein
VRSWQRLLVGSVLTACWVRPAFAEGSSEAAEHFQNGLRLGQAGELDAAAQAFQSAYQASPNYSVLFNLGQTFALLGKPAEAVDALSRYLRDGGAAIPAARREAVERSIALHSKRLGQVEFELVPANACIEVDGQVLADSQLGASLKLAAGTHGLLFKAPGYREQGQSLLVKAGQRSKVEVRLEPISAPAPALGGLHVLCDVPEVAVHVDRERLGETPFATALLIPQGKRHVQFSRPGYETSDLEILVSAGQVATVPCQLRPASVLAPDVAVDLRLTLREPDSQVTLDGAPFGGGLVPIGKHRIEARRPGFRPWQRDVDLPPGKSTTLELALTPEPTYAEEYRARINRRRYWAYGLGAGGSALLGTAVVLWLVNRVEHEEWARRQTALEQTPPGDDLEARLQRFHDQSLTVQRLNDWTVATGLAGGALLTAGAALFFTAGDPDRYGELSARSRMGGSELRFQKRW